MPFATVNNINLYYELHGSGDPLVLINGLGYDLWMWHKMVPGLAEHFQVVTFDNRGVGQSDKPAGPYTAQMLANDLARLLETLDIEQAAVMGHSMGGFVAQALVLSRPHLVSKLILSATNFGGPNHIPVTPEALAILMDTQADPVERLRRGIVVSCAPGFAEARPEVIESWIAHRLETPLDPQGYQAQLAIGLALTTEEASFESRLKNVQAPTLILFGEYDKVVPPGNAELLARDIKDSKTTILSGAGHFFPLEVPQAANEAIITFLER
ncbi:MAG: alpha/beta fold hydrolase [Chloroflexota bacterium]|jgi:pimeloyl-ACP methyl ester carboxylesterase